MLVQLLQRAKQPFAHVGLDCRRRLAPADDFGGSEIHGDDFGVRAAEIDEKSERVQGSMDQRILESEEVRS
jgi:hypothetical protein